MGVVGIGVVDVVLKEGWGIVEFLEWRRFVISLLMCLVFFFVFGIYRVEEGVYILRGN